MWNKTWLVYVYLNYFWVLIILLRLIVRVCLKGRVVLLLYCNRIWLCMYVSLGMYFELTLVGGLLTIVNLISISGKNLLICMSNIIILLGR